MVCRFHSKYSYRKIPRRAKLRIAQLYEQRFSKSIRLLLVIENTSGVHARNCIPYLRVSIYQSGEVKKVLSKEMMPSKKAF